MKEPSQKPNRTSQLENERVLPHPPNSEGAEFRRKEIHRVLAEAFDHPESRQRAGWSAARLAELVGYSELTVKRDIAYMRKTQMLPIGYDRKRDTYFYKERVAAFPTTQVSEGELICLCGMMRAMEPFRNTPFVKKIRPLIDKFIEGMPPELRVSFRKLEKRISFRSTGIDAHLDPAVFETVIAALLKDEELAIDYVKMHYEEDGSEGEKWTAAGAANAAGDGEETGNGNRTGTGEKDAVIRDGADEEMATRGEVADPDGGGGNREALTLGARSAGERGAGRALEDTRTTLASARAAGKPERRMIEPVHLACVDNGWYLFAYDPSRGKIRRFLLTRMNAVQVTGRTFKPRAFDIDEAMAPSFGIFDGDGVPVNLRIQFREKGVRLIEERSWHPSERIEREPDGTIVLSMQVAHTPQLEGWILHWGRLAKVLEPAAVREGVERQAREVVERWVI